jgi:mannose-6-phosphate isomerase-like protein (cupin superfamily)
MRAISEMSNTSQRAAESGEVIVIPPGQGRPVQRRYGEQTVIKVAEAETRGAYAVRENAAPAGFGGVPFHRHTEAEEAFYILEGEMAVYTTDRTLASPAGSFVLIPRGAVHSFANPGAVPLRWLTIFSPAWVSGWIEAESELLRSSSTEAPDPDKWAAIGRKYGLEIVGPPPALPAKHPG